jgi:diguanylate cyclase (GGDEF)-like protein
MIKSRQELLEIAQKKLQDSRLSKGQRETLLQMLDLMVELADKDGGTEPQSAGKILSNATHHHNLLAIIQQQAAELDAFKRISLNLTSNLELQGVLDAVVTEAMQLLSDARDAHIFLYQDGQLKFGASLDSDGVRNRIFSLPRQNGMTYSVAQNKKSIVVDNLRAHTLFMNGPIEWNGSIAGIPLMTGENVVGVMNMARFSIGGFTPAEIRLLELLADQAAIAIMNARLHLAVSNQAMGDSLTGLPNRRALDARLDNEVNRSLRYGHSFGVLMMDLDGFKSINDGWGHAFGDQVLRDVGRFLSEALRASDFLARYGGDELTMIIPEATLEIARQAAEKIHERLSTFRISLPDGTKGGLGLSGGIAIYPTHARTASDVLRAADEALYHAKKHARGTFVTARGFTGELQKPKNLK